MAIEGANTALETVRFMGLAWLFPVSLGQILDLEYYFLTVLDLDTNLEFASTNVTYPVETLPLTPCCSLVTGTPPPPCLDTDLGSWMLQALATCPGWPLICTGARLSPDPDPSFM